MTRLGIVERMIEQYLPGTFRPYWEKIRSSDAGYRIAHGSFWSTMGAGANQGFGVVISIVTARILGKGGFGEFGVIVTTVGMFSVFAAFGLGTTATRYIAELRVSDRERAGKILALSGVIAFVTGTLAAVSLYIAAPWLASRTLSAPQLAPYLQIGAGLIFFGAISGAQAGALSGFESFKALAKINLLSGIISLPVSILTVYYWGIPGAIAGRVFIAAITCGLYDFAIRREASRFAITIQYVNCLTERHIVINYSLPSLFTNLLVIPVTWVSSAIIVNQPGGFEEMGVLNVAQQWRQAYLFLPSVLGQVVLPIISSEYSSASDKQLQKIVKNMSKMYLLIGIPMLILLSIVSPLILAAYGKSFISSWQVFVVVQVFTFFQIIQSPYVKILELTGKMWVNFMLNIVWATIGISLTYVFASKGALGYALAYFAAFSVYGVLLKYKVTKYLIK